MSAQLNSAVGFSRIPIEITGKLSGDRLQYDEAANIIKLFATKIYGITDDKLLDTISVSYYADSVLGIELKGLGDKAWPLRDLLVSHSKDHIIEDGMGARVIKTPHTTPSKALADTLNALAKKYKLTAELEQAVSEIEELQEAKRAAEVADFFAERATTSVSDIIGKPSDKGFDAKCAAAFGAIARSALGLDEDARVRVIIEREGDKIGATLSGEVTQQQVNAFRDLMIMHAGHATGKNAAIGEFNDSQVMFGSEDVGAMMTATIDNAIMAYGCRAGVAAAVQRAAALATSGRAA